MDRYELLPHALQDEYRKIDSQEVSYADKCEALKKWNSDMEKRYSDLSSDQKRQQIKGQAGDISESMENLIDDDCEISKGKTNSLSVFPKSYPKPPSAMNVGIQSKIIISDLQSKGTQVAFIAIGPDSSFWKRINQELRDNAVPYAGAFPGEWARRYTIANSWNKLPLIGNACVFDNSMDG